MGRGSKNSLHAEEPGRNPERNSWLAESLLFSRDEVHKIESDFYFSPLISRIFQRILRGGDDEEALVMAHSENVSNILRRRRGMTLELFALGDKSFTDSINGSECMRKHAQKITTVVQKFSQFDAISREPDCALAVAYWECAKWQTRDT